MKNKVLKRGVLNISVLCFVIYLTNIFDVPKNNLSTIIGFSSVIIYVDFLSYLIIEEGLFSIFFNNKKEND